MADQDSFEIEEQAAKTKDVKKTLMFFVWAIILGVVGFCEILYVAMILPAFPDGLVQWVAIAGACATGASAVALLVGKLHWFSHGPQTFASWGFVAVETVILSLNVLLAVQLHNRDVSPWLTAWAQFYPIAPIAAFVGWGIILFLDRDNVVRAFQRDQADKQQKAEIEFNAMAHRAKMKVKHQSLKIISGYLEETMEGQPNLLALRKTADQIYDSILTDISGQHISSRIPRSKGIVEGSVSLPQTGSIDVPAQDVEDKWDRDIRMMNERQEAIDAKIACAGNCGKIGAKANWCYFPENWDILYCPSCYQIAKAERAKK